MSLTEEERGGYLRACRTEAIRFIEGLVPPEKREHPAYRAVFNYPLREAKGLRPALAIASCRALGGSLSEIVPTAAVLELLHNAFLVHDDIEDGSELRRHVPTLSAQLGIPLAVHAGDTMLSLALGPLLDNMRLLDLGRALRVLDLVATVMRRTVEGQALELAWIAENDWKISADSYIEMATLKTAWYTFAGPLMAGAIVANAQREVVEALRDFALCLGVAFQIRDDTLNLLGTEDETGKERWGDLWEGKRTLILALFFDKASPEDAAFVRGILRKQRGTNRPDAGKAAQIDHALKLLNATLDSHQLQLVRRAFEATPTDVFKTEEEVGLIRTLLEPSVHEASHVAHTFATRASEQWSKLRSTMAASIHRDLIESVLGYAVNRGH